VTAICVYCASSERIDPRYIELAAVVGTELARRGHTLISGGGSVSCMGAVAKAARAGGARTIGVIPQALVDREIAHTGLTELHVVDTMHQRKAMLFELADAFIVAPGGMGTLEEAFEQLTGLYLDYHSKPIVFLDVDGFWPPLAAFLDHAVEVEIMRPEARALFRIASSASAALDALAVW